MKLLLSYYFLLIVVATSCTQGREVLISPNQNVYEMCVRITEVVRRDTSLELAHLRNNVGWDSCKTWVSSLESDLNVRVYCSEKLKGYGFLK